MKGVCNLRLLVLGVNSWIGSCLVKALANSLHDVEGTSRGNFTPNNSHGLKMYQCNSPEDYSNLIQHSDADVVINLLRGEKEEDFIIHESIVRACKLKDIFYCYASSALALDGYSYADRLTEDLDARALSEYGVFKARCEAKILNEMSLRSLILRFSSIQGWPTHKAARNELFCRKIIGGDEVFVDRGVIQNRLYDQDFVNMIIILLMDQKTGVYHLGASDSSEEFFFLKKICKRFSLDDSLVLQGNKKLVNANLIVDKFLREYPAYSFSENDTLDKLVAHAPLWLR